jgi:OOP family OmpA-OmpF porin
MKRTYVIIIVLFLTTKSFSQNLVPNPGFEDFFSCPQSINTNKANKKIAPHWNSSSYGTPDLYNKCSTLNMGVQNVTGSTEPFKGDGFAGIIVWEGKTGFREYLQTDLMESLKANQVYIVSFWYQLSSYSKYCADRICFSFSDSAVFYKQEGVLPIFPAYAKIKPKALDPYTGSWELLEIEYTAKGNERYLTIGNFYDNIHTKTTHLYLLETKEPMLEQAAYYYIDEVSVIEKNKIVTSQKVEPTLNNKKVSLENSYVLENVLFEFKSDTLLPASHKSLDEIVSLLNQYPGWKIKIAGYTDNTGTEQYNLDLSERRANAVKQYLIGKGIKEDRIQHKGCGKTKPITTGTDEQSKKMNRRVEVDFY